MKKKSLKSLVMEDKFLAKIESRIVARRAALRREFESRFDFSQYNAAARANALFGKTIRFTERVVNGKEMVIAEVEE